MNTSDILQHVYDNDRVSLHRYDEIEQLNLPHERISIRCLQAYI